MEVCFYCKEVFKDTDKKIENALSSQTYLNLYHMKCWKVANKNQKFLNQDSNIKKTKKNWINIMTLALAICFILQIITVIIIIFIKHS